MGQSRLCRVECQLSRLDRLRQEIFQRRRKAMGPARCTTIFSTRPIGPCARRSPIPKKIAIMGGSYGGYETLVGMTFTPDRFACGVDIVGPSNLMTLLKSIPPYWGPALQMFKDRVGDPGTEAGRKLLDRPVAADLCRPNRAAAAHRPGSARPARQASRGRPDRACDGRKEHPGHVRAVPRRRPRLSSPGKQPGVHGRDGSVFRPASGGPLRSHRRRTFEGSTITVPVGADQVPGLASALNEHKAK